MLHDVDVSVTLDGWLPATAVLMVNGAGFPDSVTEAASQNNGDIMRKRKYFIS